MKNHALYSDTDGCILIRADVLIDTLEDSLYKISDLIQNNANYDGFNEYLNKHSALCDACYCGFVYNDEHTIFTVYAEKQRQAVLDAAKSRLISKSGKCKINVMEINTITFYSELIELLEPYRNLDISLVLAGLSFIDGNTKAVVRLLENAFPQMINTELH